MALFTPRFTGLGNFALNNDTFVNVYMQYEARLSEKAKDICLETVLCEDGGVWIVQSDFDLIGRPAGFGDTLKEAAMDFMQQMLQEH